MSIADSDPRQPTPFGPPPAAAATSAATDRTMTGGTTRSAVVELRQYTLVPRARDAFVALFEQLLEPQEATGMRVLGQFRDLDRPNAFAWLRGFPDMTRRREVLEAFYGGPVWAAHRDRLNAMLIDSDDVLLLEPADPGPTLDDLTAPRPPVGTPDEPASRLLVEVSPVAPSDTEQYLRRYRQAITPLVVAGARLLPTLRTLHAVNTFPRLPVREGVHVAVTLVRFADQRATAALASHPAYQAALADPTGRVAGPRQRLRLIPTPRSALR
jgi:hypothetical protein